jgi:hypothetical protein
VTHWLVSAHVTGVSPSGYVSILSRAAFEEMGYAQTLDDVEKIILGVETAPEMNVQRC